MDDGDESDESEERGKTRPDREVHGAPQSDLKAEEGRGGAGKEDRPGEALVEQALRHGG
jgi:hypothetical protein